MDGAVELRSVSNCLASLSALSDVGRQCDVVKELVLGKERRLRSVRGEWESVVEVLSSRLPKWKAHLSSDEEAAASRRRSERSRAFEKCYREVNGKVWK